VSNRHVGPNVAFTTHGWAERVSNQGIFATENFPLFAAARFFGSRLFLKAPPGASERRPWQPAEP
jgi:hypothetical protein